MTARPALARLALLLAASTAAGAASAQYYYGPGYGPPPGPYGYNAPPPPGRYYGRPYDEYAPQAPRPLSARAIVDRLEDMGYDDVGRPRFTGTLYIVEATGPGDTRQQITVDAIRGVILNRIVIARQPDDDDDDRPRRLGRGPLDTNDLDRPRVERSPAPRREAGRPAPIETEPLPPPAAAEGGATARPADPRLDPTTPPRAAARPFEGRDGREGREARTEPRRTAPSEGGARPFGINPNSSPANNRASEGEAKRSTPGKPPAQAKPDGKAAPETAPKPPVEAARPADAQPPVDAKKPVAEARPATGNKPVRVIQGVTPLASGETRAQLDNLPRPPEPAAPTGQ